MGTHDLTVATTQFPEGQTFRYSTIPTAMFEPFMLCS